MSRRYETAFAGAATALVLVLAVRPAVPVAGQEARSLLMVDLVRMLTASNYDRNEVAEIVRMNCVAFEPGPRDRAGLRRLPNGDAVLAEIDRCQGRTATVAGYRRGVPRALPVRPAVKPDEKTPGPVQIDAKPDVGDAEVVASLPDLTPPILPAEERSEPDVSRGIVPESPPRLLNLDDVTRSLLAAYRPAERKGGEVVLRIHVSADGTPDGAEVRSTMGDPDLATAALEVVDVMVFAPAESRGKKVAAWTDLPFRFKAP